MYLSNSNILTLELKLKYFRNRLERAFSIDTCYPGRREVWNSNNPSCGHCALVAAAIQKQFGGYILSSTVGGTSHWYNQLVCYVPEQGEPVYVWVDLTGDQFGYAKIQISRTPLYPSSESKRRSPNEFNSETLERYKRFIDCL